MSSQTTKQRKPDVANLEQLLERLGEATRRDEPITLRLMVTVVGRRSFGPLLLVAGLIAFSPLSAIPGVPTMVALLVLLVAGQFLFRRRHFWLPAWLLNRSLPRRRVEQGLRFLRKPARWIDRWLHPRLEVLTHEVGVYVIAVLCAVIAACMPALELVPYERHCRRRGADGLWPLAHCAGWPPGADRLDANRHDGRLGGSRVDLSRARELRQRSVDPHRKAVKNERQAT